MKRKRALFIFMLLAVSCFGGRAQTNSELQAGTSEVEHDTLVWLDKINLAVAENDSLNHCRASYKLGIWFDKHENRERAYFYLKNALEIAQQIKYTKAAGTIINYIASLKSEEGEHNEAIELYKNGIKTFETGGNAGRIPGLLMNISAVFIDMGKPDSAISYSTEALEMRLASKDSFQLAFYYWQLGSVYEYFGDTTNWENYLHTAYALRSKDTCVTPAVLANIYEDLGWIALNRNQYAAAFVYFDTLQQIGNANNMLHQVAGALSFKADVMRKQKKYNEALQLLLQAQDINVEGELAHELSKNNEIAQLYLDLNQPQKSVKYLLKNIDKNTQAFPELRKTTYYVLYEANKMIGNNSDALHWYENFSLLKDSLQNADMINYTRELSVQYETEKKEQQIELLTVENRLKSQLVNAGISLLTILVVLILLILYILNIRKKQAVLAQNNLQQQVLRAQMNPHFIFNVLGSIQNFMMQNDTRLASGFLAQFASLTRATLNNSAAETITLADEIEMLQNYIELERMRTKNRFEFSINYNEDLEIDFIQIPPMLIQPFVENSIKHGFKSLNRKGFLKLSISDKGNWVEFIIEDNGDGIQQNTASPKKHKSMAMHIFEKRRKLIQQKHNKDFKFEMVNLKDISPDLTGVKITINIPVLDND